jgi:tetratricopeptide (TPR) repeat protein
VLPCLLNAQTRDPALYGRAYLAEGDHAGAIENYQEAARVNPFDPVALNNLAVARAAAGDYQSALDLLARANKMAANRPDIAENYRQLQSWMDGQLRGVPAAPRVAQEVQKPTGVSGMMFEPPALWHEGAGRAQRNPILQASSPEEMSSYVPKKKKKKRSKRSPVVCSPKLVE